MASLGMSFDPSAVEPVSFEDVPPGEYVCELTDTDVGPTKNGKGQILKAVWTVLDGDYANRKIFQNINYMHENPQAQQIGQGQFSALCRAIGFNDHVEDTEVLHGGQAIVVLKMGKEQNGYAARPEVKATKPVNPQAPQGKPAATAPAQQRTAAPATQPAQRPAAAQPARPATAGARPWGARATA